SMHRGVGARPSGAVLPAWRPPLTCRWGTMRNRTSLFICWRPCPMARSSRPFPRSGTPFTGSCWRIDRPATTAGCRCPIDRDWGGSLTPTSSSAIALIPSEEGRERMRILKVTPVSVAYPEPNDDNNTRYLTLCRIEADDGTVGWGESITQFPESTAATERLIEGLAPLVVGREPMDH